MNRRLITTTATALAVIALTACGGSSEGGGASDGGSTDAADLVALMVDKGAPQDEAECIADKLDGVSVDELSEFFDLVDSDEEVLATEGVAEKFLNANAECTLAE